MNYDANQPLSFTVRFMISSYGTPFVTIIAEHEEPEFKGSYWEREGYLHLQDVPVSFNVRQDFNQKAEQISALQAKMGQVTKEFQETIGKLQTEITKLQALENKS